MPDVAFAAPMLRGKLEAWPEMMRTCQPGNGEYEESRRRLGVRREAAWLQQPPTGEVADVLLKGDDLQRVLEGLGSSEEPFDRWFRDTIEQVHGFDMTDPQPPPEAVLDFRA